MGIAIFVILVLIGASHDANAGSLTVKVVDASRELKLSPHAYRPPGTQEFQRAVKKRENQLGMTCDEAAVILESMNFELMGYSDQCDLMAELDYKGLIQSTPREIKACELMNDIIPEFEDGTCS